MSVISSIWPIEPASDVKALFVSSPLSLSAWASPHLPSICVWSLLCHHPLHLSITAFWSLLRRPLPVNESNYSRGGWQHLGRPTFSPVSPSAAASVGSWFTPPTKLTDEPCNQHNIRSHWLRLWLLTIPSSLSVNTSASGCGRKITTEKVVWM